MAREVSALHDPRGAICIVNELHLRGLLIYIKIEIQPSQLQIRIYAENVAWSMVNGISIKSACSMHGA
jgi:hypothetical protein